MKKINFALVFSILLMAGCTSITRVEDFKEDKSGSLAINYKDEKLKLHTNIFINNGKEKHYAHGFFHIPLFPSILFSKDDSSLDNDLMVVATIIGVTQGKALIQRVTVNDSVVFENLRGECKPGLNFVGCYFRIPFKAANANAIDLNGFVFSISNQSSVKKNFRFKKDNNIEWRYTRGNRYSKR